VDRSNLVPIVAEDTGRALAIGSAFKLYVLAALIREIESGRRRWSDVVPIDSLSKSLPSGFLQTWPAGTPVTLQTLATLMISISDNTAADHLLHILGRENVEAVQTVAGHAHPALNQPFLSTRELFVLKSPDHTTLLDRYVRGSTTERRAILRDPGVTSRQRRGPDFTNGPIAVERVEWFASTADLARLMVWIRDHSASGPGMAARDVLSVNKGIGWPRESWKYVAFKGGSEPGVLNLTFMAQRVDGQWLIIVGSWNNPEKAVDEAAFAALVTRIRDLATAR
jgi:beta-lactamase class A